MPELPEVETTVRAIRPFENTILKKIIIHNRNLRWQVDENLEDLVVNKKILTCLLYTSPSPRDGHQSRMPSSA